MTQALNQLLIISVIIDYSSTHLSFHPSTAPPGYFSKVKV